MLDDLSDRRFILMDRGQEPFRDESGRITSSGAVGEVGLDNAYLRMYGTRPRGSAGYESLAVGQVLRGVHYNLSGSAGDYDVWRVR